jgi:hypothetical protein
MEAKTIGALFIALGKVGLIALVMGVGDALFSWIFLVPHYLPWHPRWVAVAGAMMFTAAEVGRRRCGVPWPSGFWNVD